MTPVLFRDPTALARCVLVMMLLQVVVMFAGIKAEHDVATARHQLTQLRHEAVSGARINFRERAAALDASCRHASDMLVAQWSVHAVSALLILCWIQRVAENARSFSPRPMRHGPVAAIGWYFVPIANLWKPYQAMKEIWRVTMRTPDGHAAHRIVATWWFFWILGWLPRSGRGGSWPQDALLPPPDLTAAMVVSGALPLALGTSFALLVHRLSAAQAERRSMPATVAGAEPA